SVTGITWNFHNQLWLAAQTLGMTISDNTVNPQNSSPDSGWTQFNQNRKMVISNNVFNGPGYLDPSRNPTDLLISGNTFNGISEIGAGESGANVRILKNTFTATKPTRGNAAVEVGAIFGALIQDNTIEVSGVAGNYTYAISDVNGAVSPNTKILDN